MRKLGSNLNWMSKFAKGKTCLHVLGKIWFSFTIFFLSGLFYSWKITLVYKAILVNAKTNWKFMEKMTFCIVSWDQSRSFFLICCLMTNKLCEWMKLGWVVVIVHSGNGWDGKFDFFSGSSSVRPRSARSDIAGLSSVPVLVRRSIQKDQSHDVNIPHAVNA